MHALFDVKRNVAVGVIGALGVFGAGGAAYAATPSSTTAPAPHAIRAHHKVRSLLARADRATVEVKVKGAWVTYGVDRGKVSAVSATSVTLALADGTSVTESISPTTKFDGVTSAGAVTVGRAAVVISRGTTATRIGQRAASATPAAATPAA
jgi:hypothetical protein